MAMVASSLARRLAMAAPRPREPPVTRATLPTSLMEEGEEMREFMVLFTLGGLELKGVSRLFGGVGGRIVREGEQGEGGEDESGGDHGGGWLRVAGGAWWDWRKNIRLRPNCP